jgi:class 3 adenylate cyclase
MPLTELDRLLAERHGSDDPAAVDERIRQRFGARRAVLFSDMAGFARLTEQRGIEHFLTLIYRMRQLCGPPLDQYGRLVKTEADNLFAVFDSPGAAVAAARGMVAACVADSAGRPDDEAVRIGVGIGWGDVLDIDGLDLFGHEVNLASRLGEDVSDAGDILVTRAVFSALDVRGEQRTIHASGMDIAYWRLADG